MACAVTDLLPTDAFPIGVGTCFGVEFHEILEIKSGQVVSDDADIVSDGTRCEHTDFHTSQLKQISSVTKEAVRESSEMAFGMASTGTKLSEVPFTCAESDFCVGDEFFGALLSVGLLVATLALFLGIPPYGGRNFVDDFRDGHLLYGVGLDSRDDARDREADLGACGRVAGAGNQTKPRLFGKRSVRDEPLRDRGNVRGKIPCMGGFDGSR